MKYEAVLMSGRNVGNIYGDTAYLSFYSNNKAHALKEAKDAAIQYNVAYPRIELQPKDATLVGEYEFYKSVNNVIGWFDLNKGYPDRAAGW